jgi:23S rRNA (cytosine1962-C5)-methyltransferase
MNTNPVLTLKPEKSRQLYGRHPWVRASSLRKGSTSIESGSVVDLEDERGRWLGRGIYNEKSQIAVRLYSFHPEIDIDEQFFMDRLQNAIALRKRLGYLEPHTGSRLIFSEADGLSGLVVDRYGPYLVLQVTALAIQARIQSIIDFLCSHLQPEGVLVRTDPRMAGLEGIAAREEVVHGAIPAEGVTIDENQIKVHFDLAGSQKTGLYLDQRENRRAAARYVAGGEVLDICCHVGGFGLAASVLGKASAVTFVDSSSKTLDAARRNASDNKVSAAEFVEGDCFDTLAAFQSDGRKFDWISLDPPRFASSRRTIPAALQAYHRLNRLAISILRPGGILVTSSCSGNLARQQFVDMLGGVSRKSRREILILESRGAAPDHPVRLACPETDYLKCVIACVE